MNLKNQSPVYMPACFQENLEEHASKAALMDLVWLLAADATGFGIHVDSGAGQLIMQHIYDKLNLVLHDRKLAKARLNRADP